MIQAMAVHYPSECSVQRDFIHRNNKLHSDENSRLLVTRGEFQDSRLEFERNKLSAFPSKRRSSRSRTRLETSKAEGAKAAPESGLHTYLWIALGTAALDSGVGALLQFPGVQVQTVLSSLELVLVGPK